VSYRNLLHYIYTKLRLSRLMSIHLNLLCSINGLLLSREVVYKYSSLTLDMKILVISSEDSRLPIVDLARTLGDMAKHEKLFPEDVSIDLIHENLTGTPANFCTNRQKIS
jgi:hypothetical protein